MYRYIQSDIYYDNDQLKIDWDRDDHNGITLNKGKNKHGDPYVAKSQDLGGHQIFSVYPYRGDEHVRIYKGIKHGELSVEDYRDWLYDVAVYIYDHIIMNNRPDILAVPVSSSPLIEDVAKEICRISKGRLDYLPDAFKKNPVDKITIDIPDGFASEHPAFVKKAQAAFNKMQESGVFEAKSTYKPALKFYRNIYTGDEKYLSKLKGKAVAVLDDSMSSKTTMINILDVCDNVYQTSDCYGITIFKRTGRG